jgi:hypothetical protein
MAFDPVPHLMKLKGSDYLQTVWRLVWLRDEHPDAQIDTEVVFWDHDKEEIMVRAVVVLPKTGARASAHCVCSLAEFRNGYAEKCETQAVGRALAMLGYGTAFAGQDLDEGERPVDSPPGAPANGAQGVKAAPKPAGPSAERALPTSAPAKGASVSAPAKGSASEAKKEQTPAEEGTPSAFVRTAAGGLELAREQEVRGPDGKTLGARARALRSEIDAAGALEELHGKDGLAKRVLAAGKAGEIAPSEQAALFDAINRRNAALREKSGTYAG